MEGNFSDLTDEQRSTSYQANRFYGSAMVELPLDDPMLWTTDEQTTAEVCSLLFAQEYFYDFNAKGALIRLGVSEDRAGDLAKHYMKHWMVQRQLRECTMNFRRTKIATEDSVLSLIWRDASNFGAFSNPVARVNAQRQLSKVLCMEPEDKRRALETVESPNGGVMVVDGATSLEDWEVGTVIEQKLLKEEVEK
jgi:hypothetical protein